MAEWSLARYRYAFAMAAVLLWCAGSGSAQAAASEAHELSLIHIYFSKSGLHFPITPNKRN